MPTDEIMGAKSLTQLMNLCNERLKEFAGVDPSEYRDKGFFKLPVFSDDFPRFDGRSVMSWDQDSVLVYDGNYRIESRNDRTQSKRKFSVLRYRSTETVSSVTLE